VELGSHTDARGSDSYNMILSKKRSDSAVKYIIDHGIVKDRIIAKGYGETQLVNHCKNGVECPDDVHRKNRRTEFKILEMDGK
jgi:outer membrane protein OmpA-like peptidoglycan-associated protein